MAGALTLTDLSAALEKAGAPFYVLLGPSVWHRERAVQLVREATVPEEDRALAETRGRARECDIGSLLDSARTLPLGVKRRLVILGDGESLRAEEIALLADYAASPQRTTTVVLYADQLPAGNATRDLKKRACIVDCAEPRTWEVGGWIQAELERRGLAAESGVPRALQELLGDSTQEIAAGLDKLALYVAGRRSARLTVVDVEAALTRVPHGTVWEFIEALEDKDRPRALRALQSILDVGEPPESVIRLVLRSRRQLLAGLSARQAGGGEDAVLDAMGTSPRARQAPRVRRAILGRVGRHRLVEVSAAIPLLLEADSRLKGGGGAPDDVLTRLVLDLTTQGTRRGLSAYRHA